VKRTPWFPLRAKPILPGAYEGRERCTGLVIPNVHWRRLDDTEHYDWYIFKGVLGPFALWECVSHKITSWRGLTEKSR
jgi:hypothetical protein